MKTKLTALLIATAALVAGGAAAHAAPIPVASYTFQGQDDVNAFQKVSGGKCKRKWQGNQALGIGVGPSTNNCVFRSSVVGDASDQYADQGMVATVTSGGGTPKLQKKTYVGIGVRRSDTDGYVLRILPTAHKWQYIRDPKGAAPPKLEASGTGKFIKIASKPNLVAIRAFSYGGNTTSVIASVNGTNVVSSTDSGADQPNGRQTTVNVGVKGSGAGTGVLGVFDNVTVQVPNPF
jgi:hypothetical protein